MEATESQHTMDVKVLSPAEAAREVALEISTLVREKPDAVLGLATGNTPRGVYAELVRLHRDGDLDLSRVRSFCLDEYRGLGPSDSRSFHAFMWEHLWGHVNADPAHVHIPDGLVPLDELPEHCAAYDRVIEEAGGIDLQLLGIGRNGHIAFNEPGSRRDSRTRLVLLEESTRADAAAEWGGLERVPMHAITMGTATILEARRVRVMAFGEAKAEAVKRALHGPISSACPASFLREHADTRLYVDPAAAPA
jgi:glucosamine-6-phosphate deaminase